MSIEGNPTDDGLIPLPDDHPSKVNFENAKLDDPATDVRTDDPTPRIEAFRASLQPAARDLFDQEYARQVKQVGGGAEAYIRTLETFTDRTCHNAAARINAYDEESSRDQEAIMMVAGMVASGVVQTENRRLTPGVVADRAIEVAQAIVRKARKRG